MGKAAAYIIPSLEQIDAFRNYDIQSELVRKQMDGLMDIFTDGWTNGRMNELIYPWMDEPARFRNLFDLFESTKNELLFCFDLQLKKI